MRLALFLLAVAADFVESASHAAPGATGGDTREPAFADEPDRANERRLLLVAGTASASWEELDVMRLAAWTELARNSADARQLDLDPVAVDGAMPRYVHDRGPALA